MNYYNIDTNKLNYIIYCRKSSEGEDRQVQSLETQIRELKEHAERNNLNIVKVIAESKSAFKTGRPGFEEMVKLIKNNKANAILVIRANRISRNPVDAGHIISCMDDKKLLFIRTPNSTCYTCSSTDKMMLGLELIISKKDSDDKGEMVKEGQRTKALKGIPHGAAALGFINDKTEEKGNRKWIVDTEKFPKLQILFKMFLTGTWSVGKLHKYAIEGLKLTTGKYKNIGGKLIQRSSIYKILLAPIYAGFFFYENQRYQLDPNLPRIITEEEYQKIKKLLSRKNIPKTQKHECVFAGFISSPKGEYIGPDFKFQLICDCGEKFAFRDKEKCPFCNTSIQELQNPKYLTYTYYYNISKKKRGESYKYISEHKILDALIAEFDDKAPLSDDFVNWSRKHIKEMRNEEINHHLLKEKIAKNDIESLVIKKKRRRELLADGLITEEEYKADIAELEAQYTPSYRTIDFDWTKRANEIIDIVQEYASIMKVKDKIQPKRTILSRMGSNLIWDDKKLSIYYSKPIQALFNGIEKAKRKNERFEPKNCIIYKGLNRKTEVFSSVLSIMLRTWRNIRREILIEHTANEN